MGLLDQSYLIHQAWHLKVKSHSNNLLRNQIEMFYRLSIGAHTQQEGSPILSQPWLYNDIMFPAVIQ